MNAVGSLGDTREGVRSKDLKVEVGRMGDGMGEWGGAEPLIAFLKFEQLLQVLACFPRGGRGGCLATGNREAEPGLGGKYRFPFRALVPGQAGAARCCRAGLAGFSTEEEGYPNSFG